MPAFLEFLLLLIEYFRLTFFFVVANQGLDCVDKGLDNFHHLMNRWSISNEGYVKECKRLHLMVILFWISVRPSFHLPWTLFEAPSTNNPTFDWMNSISERHAPSPIGYFWYLATLIGGTCEKRADRRGSIRHAMGSEGWNRL